MSSPCLPSKSTSVFNVVDDLSPCAVEILIAGQAATLVIIAVAAGLENPQDRKSVFQAAESLLAELCWNLGDGGDQAALCAGVLMTSTPLRNVTPWTTLGNWFSPCSLRQVFAAAITT